MGRLFKISGNYEENGEWKKPDPFYAGKILIEDEKDGQFYGFVDELCAKSPTKLADRRYVVGRLHSGANGYRAIEFYAISNSRKNGPRKVIIPDLGASSSNATSDQSPVFIEGVWAAKLSSLGGFKVKGKARFSYEEVEYTLSKATLVKKRYLEVDLKIIEELTAFMIGGFLADVGLKGFPESEKPGL